MIDMRLHYFGSFQSSPAKNSSGGPKDLSMLLTMEIVEGNFKELAI